MRRSVLNDMVIYLYLQIVVRKVLPRRRTRRQRPTLINKDHYLYKQTRRTNLGEDNPSSQVRNCAPYKDMFHIELPEKAVQDLRLPGPVLRPRLPPPQRHLGGRARGGGGTAW